MGDIELANTQKGRGLPVDASPKNVSSRETSQNSSLPSNNSLISSSTIEPLHFDGALPTPTSQLRGSKPLGSIHSATSALETATFPARETISIESARPRLQFADSFFERNLPYDLLKFISREHLDASRGEVLRQLEGSENVLIRSFVAHIPKFTRRYLDNVLTRPAWQELGPEVGFKVIKLAVDLLELPELRRLSDIRQMNAAYSSSFHEILNHTRLEHSLEVGFNAARMARRLQLGKDKVMEIAAAGMLHDVGHPPFSHNGELILADLLSSARSLERLGGGNTFDHERYGWSLIRGNAISSILREHGLTSAGVVGMLQHDHPFHAVIDWEDRLSYLARDLFGATEGYSQSTRDVMSKRFRVVKAIDQFRRGARQYDGQFVFAEPEASGENTASEKLRIPEKILNLRLELLSEVSLRPEVLLVNGLLKGEISKTMESGAITPEQFLKLSDSRVISKMRPEVRQALKNGVDQAYEMINIFYAEELTKKGLDFVYSPDFNERLVKAIAPHLDSENQSQLVVAVSAAESKQVRVKYLKDTEDGKVVSAITHHRDLFPWCQSICIFADREQGKRSFGELSQAVQEFFEREGFLISKADRMALYRKTPYQVQGAQYLERRNNSAS